MRIEKLVVKETFPEEKVIRSIDFDINGCNFIVDKSSKTDNITGNSIGKSTLAKIIDICLSKNSPSKLYTDDEMHQEDIAIKTYINDKKVNATLVMVDLNNDRISISRDLFLRGKKYINGKPSADSDYISKLNKIIFNSDLSIPSFRELLGKFIRINVSTDEKMVKYLSYGVRNYKYDAIYSYLFKLGDDETVKEKARLKEEKKDCINNIEAFKRTNKIKSEDILKQKLLVIENNLHEKKKIKDRIINVKDYQEQLQKLRATNLEIIDFEKDIEELNLDIKLLTQAISSQKESLVDINSKQIKELYDETKNAIETISKTFAELVDFHNGMIGNKIFFLEKRKKEKEEKLRNIIDKQKLLINVRNEVNKEIFAGDIQENIDEINTQIEKLSTEKGEVINGLEIWKENEEKISKLNNAISLLDENTSDKIIDNNIGRFNKYFSEYSSKLYGEQCFIAYHTPLNKEFPIEISHIGSAGTGEKKGLISAFDLAYYSFANDYNIVCPRFIILDKMETTDKKQIEEIYRIAKSIKAQLIVPILNEKLDFLTDEERKRSIALELSDVDKFFKI